MSLKLSTKLHPQISIEFSKTCDRNQGKGILPSINNENHYQSDQLEHRYCSHSTRLSQPKRTILPLTSRNCNNNENLTSNVQEKKEKSNKKSNRPLAAKPKSIKSKVIFERKITIEQRETPQTQNKKLKLEKIKSKNIDLLCQNEEYQPFDLAINTLCFEKTTSINNRTENRTTYRDRTNSCKVALKRVFPQPEKTNNLNGVSIYFDANHEKLSTIPGGSENGSQKFISMQSYSELIF